MNLIRKFFSKIVEILGSVMWKPNYAISTSSRAEIERLLKNDHYIVLTRKNNHLSTYLIGIVDYILYGSFGYWSHAMINIEGEVSTSADFVFVEAVGSGTRLSSISELDSVSNVVLLRPTHMPLSQWTSVLEKANSYIGRPYDTLFNMSDDSMISCVELVRQALLTDPEYTTNFSEFEKLIQQSKTLTPQMFFQCSDFEIAYIASNIPKFYDKNK